MAEVLTTEPCATCGHEAHHHWVRIVSPLDGECDIDTCACTLFKSTPVPGGAVYFGCWSSVGHFYVKPNGRSVRNARGDATDITPWGYGVEKLTPEDNRAQGAGALHHKSGWTALAVNDYTVDSRGNSKSVFCFRQLLDFDAALSEAEHVFPSIVKRVGTITREA